MLLYFSGTGNSTFVAVTLGNFIGEDPLFIPDTEIKDLTEPGERLVLVFPVYSWGVPPLVSDCISKLPDILIQRLKSGDVNINCVMTCGDEVALAPEMLIRDFKKLGLTVNSIWSVIMPNNYVLLPGFNVDSKEIEDRKLQSCEPRIIEIAQGISRGDRRIDVVRGNMAWLKSKLVFPLFKKWGIFPRKWHFRDSCISCGKCAQICPMLNVEMEKGHPVWGKRCCSCLACYHVCPVHAVEYGKDTLKKGQYLFPLKKISLRNCRMK